MCPEVLAVFPLAWRGIITVSCCKVTSSCNPVFSCRRGSGCELCEPLGSANMWRRRTRRRRGDEEERLQKMTLRFLCPLNIEWIRHFFFLSGSDRRTIMLASRRFLFSDFGKQTGYCRWILGRWQSSSTCACFRAPLVKHFWRDRPRGKFNHGVLNMKCVVTVLFLCLSACILFERFGRRGGGEEVCTFAREGRKKRCRDVLSEEIALWDLSSSHLGLFSSCCHTYSHLKQYNEAERHSVLFSCYFAM